MQFNKTRVIFGAIVAVILGLSNSGLHPISGSSGYTGAPGDSSCGQCHTGNNGSLNGTVSIDGLPATIETGEVYSLTVTVTNPNGNAALGGFQLVVLNGNNGNAGTMSNTSASSQIRVAGGKNYFGHAPAPSFPASNELSFSVDWTAPATVGSNPVIKFYASAVIANGANGNQNDRVVLTNSIIPIQSGTVPLIVDITNITNTLCANSADGSATATVSGGTSPYSYAWNNGASTPTTNTLPAGLAVVTVTDNVGASSTASANIFSPSPIILSASGSIVCDGATNGTASVLASGGVGGFDYLWPTGQTTSSISGLSEGVYEVTVTDNNNCSETANAIVTVSPFISITANPVNVSCFGQSNGSISPNITGGTPGLTYSWSNGSTQANIFNLSGGTYTITVTDSKNCSSSNEFVISQPQAITTTVSNISNVTCIGSSNGTATITASGGTPPFTFNWSSGAMGTGLSNTQSNLSAGTYTITVTDLLDCTKTANVTISQPGQILLNEMIVNSTCNGSNNGQINLNVTGLVGNATYLWSNGATSSSIMNLVPGNYIITVTDSGNGCTKSASYSISQPPILSITTNIQNPTCFGGTNGSITAQGSGGNGSYLYEWTNGSLSPVQNNLVAGVYTVTVTDAKGCTKTAAATITSPSQIQLNVIQSANATCLGASNGSLTVSASAGVNPYTYLWSNGATSAQINNVVANDYIVTVTDFNNCNIVDTFTIGTNTSFSINLLSSQNILCFGDSTGVASVTNNPTYSYLWSNGQTSSTVSNLPAGANMVVAKDNAGCESIPVIVNITQPPLLKANLISADTILCPADTNGFLNVNLSGGTGLLNYFWSHGDTLLLTDTLKAGKYTISITDQNACLEKYTFEVFKSDTIKIEKENIIGVKCNGDENGAILLAAKGGFGDLSFNWSPSGLTGDTLINLAPGKYFTTISDIGNCILIDSFVVNEPDKLSGSTTVINETSNGAQDGSIILVPIGGTAPFTVLWSNGDTTLNIENLIPGLYNYLLTDANNCTYQSWAVVGGGNCGLSATYTTQPVTCFDRFDGKIELEIVGNFSDYDISLYKDNILSTLPLDQLGFGEYSVLIADSSQCFALISNIIINSLNPPIILEKLNITKPSSTTSTDGTISAEVSGGNGNLTYEWILNNQIIGTGATINNLMNGIYQLRITDEAGCTLTIPNIILQDISSLEEISKSSIKVNPNPVSDNFTIESDISISKIEFFDVTGKNIFTTYPRDQKIISFSKEAVQIKESGIYICRVWVNNRAINKKIVVLDK